MADESPSPVQNDAQAQAETNPKGERRKNIVAVLGGIGMFVGLGLLLSPGMAGVQRHETSEESTALRPKPEPRSSAVAKQFPSASSAPSQERQTGSDSFDCMIQPFDIVDIGSAIDGRIESIAAERGDYVKQGAVLAQLESSVERVAVHVARTNAQRQGEIESGRANLSLSEKRRQRAVELHENDSLSLEIRQTVENEVAVSRAELKRARENHAMAKLQLDQAQANLARRSIYSPVSGFVIERLMAPGEVVDEDTILRVAQIDPLRVEVILPAELFGKVKPGDRAEIVPEAPRDQPYPGEISIVDPIIDGASATFGAVMLLPNPDHSLPAGLRCRVTFKDGAASSKAGVAKARGSGSARDDSA